MSDDGSEVSFGGFAEFSTAFYDMLRLYAISNRLRSLIHSLSRTSVFALHLHRHSASHASVDPLVARAFDHDVARGRIRERAYQLWLMSNQKESRQIGEVARNESYTAKGVGCSVALILIRVSVTQRACCRIYLPGKAQGESVTLVHVQEVCIQDLIRL
jgi:hypothetical protein